MAGWSSELLDNSRHAQLYCVIDKIAEDIIRGLASCDDKPDFNAFIYTLRVLTAQKAYILLGQNKKAVTELLNTGYTSIQNYINLGMIHVEHPE